MGALEIHVLYEDDDDDNVRGLWPRYGEKCP